MWTNDNDSIFTGTERTFADDWDSTAKDASASAGRRGMKRTAALAVAVLAAATMLAGCSGAQQPAAQPTTATATPAPTEVAKPEPANPVDIARKIKGCELDDGATLGEYDAMGGRFVKCAWMNNGGGTTPGTQATIRTYDHDPAIGELEELRPDDSTDVILGDGFSVVLTGADNYSSQVSPAAVAKQVGGTLQATATEKKAEAPSKPAKATKKDAPAEESEWVKGQREWAAMTEAERAAELDANEALTAPEGDVGADDIDAEEEMNGELVWAD